MLPPCLFCVIVPYKINAILRGSLLIQNTDFCKAIDRSFRQRIFVFVVSTFLQYDRLM